MSPIISESDHCRERGAAYQGGHGGGPPEVPQPEHLPGQRGPLVLAETAVSLRDNVNRLYWNQFWSICCGFPSGTSFIGLGLISSIFMIKY